MNSIGLFLFKSTLVSGILILLYVLLLRNKRMYNYNRFFLLFTLYASIQVPLLHFNWFTIPAQTAKAGSSTAFLRVVSGADSAEPYMKGYAPYYSINGAQCCYILWHW